MDIPRFDDLIVTISQVHAKYSNIFFKYSSSMDKYYIANYYLIKIFFHRVYIYVYNIYNCKKSITSHLNILTLDTKTITKRQKIPGIFSSTRYSHLYLLLIGCNLKNWMIWLVKIFKEKQPIICTKNRILLCNWKSQYYIHVFYKML